MGCKKTVQIQKTASKSEKRICKQSFCITPLGRLALVQANQPPAMRVRIGGYTKKIPNVVQ